MKNLLTNWKFWAAVIAAIVIIVCVILFFTNRTFAYVTASGLIGLLLGFIIGYYVGRKYPVAKS